MDMKKSFLFELLIADKESNSEVTTVKSLNMGLSYSESLWKDAQITNDGQDAYIEDKSLGITLQARKVEMDVPAFLLQVKGKDLQTVERFRKPVVTHIKSKLGFTSIKVVKDGVSTALGQQMYPIIKEVEKLLKGKANQDIVVDITKKVLRKFNRELYFDYTPVLSRIKI